jgi:hypothetical protein
LRVPNLDDKLKHVGHFALLRGLFFIRLRGYT